MVTVAVPEPVPGQLASDTAVRLYVLVAVGLTGKLTGEAVIPVTVVGVVPFVYVTDQGAVPVRATLSVAEPPKQIGPPPLNVAVGVARTVIVAVPVTVPVQLASDTDVRLYGVLLAVGLTVNVYGEALMLFMVCCVVPLV